jgi:hypothetical protein
MVYLILEKITPEHRTQTQYLFVNFAETKAETLKLMQVFVDQ